MAAAWADRFGPGAERVRPAIFALYAVALESADTDCLRLGEALASAADQLEGSGPIPHLSAALAACIESLHEAEGLEHPLFPERAGHFAQRLETMAAAGMATNQRSIVLDRLFVAEAEEYLERMRDALALLPPDAYALKLTAMELAQAAENIELFGIMHLARDLANSLDSSVTDLDDDLARNKLQKSLQQIAATIAAVNV